MAILLDTNILLRLFDSSDANHQPIKNLIRFFISQNQLIYTTHQNLAEFWNVSTRPTTARGGYGHPISIVTQRLKAIERLCVILESSNSVYQTWRNLLIHYKISGVAVHDARIAATMIANGIKEIVTLNKKDFTRYSELIALSPEEIPIT